MIDRSVTISCDRCHIEEIFEPDHLVGRYLSTYEDIRKHAASFRWTVRPGRFGTFDFCPVCSRAGTETNTHTHTHLHEESHESDSRNVHD